MQLQDSRQASSYIENILTKIEFTPQLNPQQENSEKTEQSRPLIIPNGRQQIDHSKSAIHWPM